MFVIRQMFKTALCDFLNCVNIFFQARNAFLITIVQTSYTLNYVHKKDFTTYKNIFLFHNVYQRTLENFWKRVNIFLFAHVCVIIFT